MLLMVDNSQGHAAYASNALLVNQMNFKPGRKQAHMHNGWFMHDGEKVIQSMIFPSDHPEYPDMLAATERHERSFD